jgi:hypothetical protein
VPREASYPLIRISSLYQVIIVWTAQPWQRLRIQLQDLVRLEALKRKSATFEVEIWGWMVEIAHEEGHGFEEFHGASSGCDWSGSDLCLEWGGEFVISRVGCWVLAGFVQRSTVLFCLASW